MNLAETFRNWNFDVGTAFVTAILFPIGVFLASLLRKYLKELTGFLLEGILDWLSRALRLSLAGTLSLRRYCRMRLVEESRFLSVPSSLEVKLDIDLMYVPLILDQRGGGSNTYSHLDLFSLGNRLRIVGDPGSGKSSLVKRLFRDACLSAIRSPQKAHLPVLIELRHVSISKEAKDSELGDWFLKLIRDEVCKTTAYRMDDCFDSFSRGSGLLVLLDGLDEVSSSNYLRVQTAITGLSKRLAQLSDRTRIVITMRTQFHQQVRDAYRDMFGRVLFLRPFSPSDIHEFLHRWPFQKERERNVARIYAELTDRPTLREMCSNPLVLSMYVAEDQAAGVVVAPESRTSFYGKVTEELLVRRRLRQTGIAPAYGVMREKRERILGKLAFLHMLDPKQPANSLDWQDAMRITREVVRCRPDEAPEVFREIARETGLVTEERSEQSLRFIHLTFCEFLAAFEAVQGQRDGFKTLLERHRSFQSEGVEPHLRSRLQEVIPFAAGLLPRIRRGRAIFCIEEMGDDALLSKCYLETKWYEGNSWPKFVERQRRDLLRTPEKSWDEKWLRRMYLFNVVVRDAQESSRHIPNRLVGLDIDDFLQRLAGNQKKSLDKLLAAFAEQDASAAFRLAELSKLDLSKALPGLVVSSCDQAPFQALVLEKALRDTSDAKRWIVLLAEAGLRSRVVAERLDSHGAIAVLEDRIAHIPSRRRWFGGGMVPKTAYSQLISVATNAGVPSESWSVYLSVLRSVRPPGSSWYNPLKSPMRESVIALVIVFVVTTGADHMFGGLPLRRVAWPITAIYAPLLFLLNWSSRVQMYRVVMFGGNFRAGMLSRRSITGFMQFLEWMVWGLPRTILSRAFVANKSQKGFGSRLAWANPFVLVFGGSDLTNALRHLDRLRGGASRSAETHQDE